MTNLKALRNRINSVGATRKITRAMQMVAASKLRRAQEAIMAARPYAESMHKTVSALVAQTPVGQLTPTARRFFDQTRPARKHLLIVITSERGLCGGFNTQILRLAQQKARALKNDGQEIFFLCVGKKATDSLKRKWMDQIVGTFPIDAAAIHTAEAISAWIDKMFDEEHFDHCTMFYSRFFSVLNQAPTAQQLIPIAKTESDHLGALYTYEPDEAQMLDQLLPSHLSAQLLRALLENAAGEQGARMTAMDSATRNAEDMISDLSLVYNRTRQAVITRELIEIISGAEAL